jgi:predicted dehydrogenase
LERKVRLAVIGLGKMGLLHASLLKVFPQVELVAICDKSALLTRIGKKMFTPTGVTVFNDVEKFSGLNLDAVYVTTPIASHYLIVNTLLTKGITQNVFCEKTLSANYEQSKELVEMAQKVGATTMVGFMKRFSVIFGKTKQLLDQKDLGEPLSFKAFAYSSDFQGLTKESKSSVARGGALRDIGCHVIDLGLWLLGDLKVGQVTSCVKSDPETETSVSFTASKSNEFEGTFEISQSMANYRLPEFGLLIECSKGKIDVNDDRLIVTPNNSAQKKWYKQDLNDSVPFFLGESEYFRENQLFLSSVEHKRQAAPSFEDASKVDCVIDEVRAKEEKQ